MITFTKEQYDAFRKAYKKALSYGKTSFMFQEHEYETAYAKYLIDYHEDKLKK